MKKKILNVALIGLVVMSVLGVATLMRGDSVAASSPTPYVETLTDSRGNSCEIQLYVDYDSQQVWGTVTTHTADTFDTYTKVEVTLMSILPPPYYSEFWETPEEEGYWGESSTIQVSGGNTVYGEVKIRWEVDYPCDAWCWLLGGRTTYVEFRHLYYQFGYWDNYGLVQGRVGNAATGYPLPYSTVTVKQSGQVIKVVETNYDGQYLVCLAPGTYTLTASHIGFYDKTYTVVVSEGGGTTKNFLLTQKSPGPIPI
jgi:hypothetical protein